MAWLPQTVLVLTVLALSRSLTHLKKTKNSDWLLLPENVLCWCRRIYVLEIIQKYVVFIIGNHSDEVNTSTIDDEFGTENADFLDCEILEVSESDLTLADITVTNFKSDPAESDIEPDTTMEVTTFRALTPCEKRSSNKYSHIDTSVEWFRLKDKIIRQTSSAWKC